MRTLLFACLLLASCAVVVNESCTDTVVCQDRGREFVCPNTLTVCSQQYESCRTLPCSEQLKICEYDGAQYVPGERFDDDCNVCTCQEDGYVICTSHSCDGTCVVDSDCPALPCPGFYCAPGEPCPPCPVNRCEQGRCVSS